MLSHDHCPKLIPYPKVYLSFWKSAKPHNLQLRPIVLKVKILAIFPREFTVAKIYEASYFCLKPKMAVVLGIFLSYLH